MSSPNAEANARKESEKPSSVDALWLLQKHLIAQSFAAELVKDFHKRISKHREKRISYLTNGKA